MRTRIDEAILRRKNGDYKESRRLLRTVLASSSYAASAHLNIAWSYDNEGKEQQAIEHYRLALKGPLSPNERFEALFGLASTYRSLGCYEDALDYFQQTITEFPNNLEAQPFYAMCLYNLGRHKEATALLLNLLVSTTDNQSIREYQRAILLYAEDLDKKW